MRTIGISLVATLLATAPVLAQVRADPGVVIGHRIAVRVNVTLADGETPYSPARDVALAFTRLGADTVIARTDEAGVITVLLPVGDYVVSTRQPYQWKGNWFTWSIAINVRADMPAVELNRANARVERHGAPVENTPSLGATVTAATRGEERQRGLTTAVSPRCRSYTSSVRLHGRATTPKPNVRSNANASGRSVGRGR